MRVDMSVSVLVSAALFLLSATGESRAAYRCGGASRLH